MSGIVNFYLPTMSYLSRFSVDVFTPGGAYIQMELVQQEIDVMRRAGYDVYVNPFVPLATKIPTMRYPINMNCNAFAEKLQQHAESY